MEQPRRLTIGVLFGFHIFEGARPAPFSFPIIRGMQTAARDRNVNLLLSCGVARRIGLSEQKPAWPEISPETDFIPVGPWNTDGLIFTLPLLTEMRIQYVRHLAEKKIPLVFIGADSGHPAILVDNEGGVRQVIEHLVWHGHRSIAFIAGYEQDTGDSVSRVNAYRRWIREFGLNDNPRLLEYGQHWDVGGYRAMRRLLQSGEKFTAVMCSNDHSAMGAMKALREAGLRIPRDVSVIGFDDVPEGLAQVPPLTSVHFPLFETGYRAVLLLVNRIEQGAGAVPEITRVSTWLVPRQSCGCLPEMVTQSAVSGGSIIRRADQPLRQYASELAQRMLSALKEGRPQNQTDELLPLCDQLADGFLRSLEDGDLSFFQNALIEILQRIEGMADESPHVWQSAVTVLRREAHGIVDGDRDPNRAERVEDMLHHARALLSESVQRRHIRLLVRQTGHEERMGLLTARLLSASDEEAFYRALREGLPQMDVRDCRVAFFEPQGEDPVAVSLLHSLEMDAPVMRFETRHFPPPGAYPAEEAFNLALLPLFFQNETLGYVAFDGGNLDPLATIVRQISSSIKSIQLHAKVLELSLTDGLTGVHNRRYFELLLQKETERSLRYNRDLVVIMIDIDNFKKYNDAHGHPAGDEALREVAQCITQGARRGLDTVSRYGGEEFAIILPETGADGAWTVAEDVRRRVECGTKFLQPTTVSLGIASLRGDQMHPQELVNRADRALYQAKTQGRNRTVLFEPWMQEAAHSPAQSGSAAVSGPTSKQE
jgi:diguanylate cyclase (GGDEF)-like protein